MSAVAGGIIAGVGAIGGALISSNAAQGAANTESNAAANASQVQQNMFNTEEANAQPWLASGQSNLATLNADMPDLTRQFTMADFQSNPGYQFQLGQGEQAMQRSAAAAGMLNSSGTQQGLNNYAQGMANTDYQQALTNFTNNQQQRYNMLSGLSSQGLSAANMTNQVGMNAANNISSNIMGSANAQAAGQIGTANAISSGINGGINSYMGYSAMNNLANNLGSQNNMPVPGYSMPQVGSGLASGYSSQPQYGLGGNTDLTSSLSF